MPDVQASDEGVMYIKLGSYLRELEAREKSKPLASRREVPTMKEIAQAVGISQAGLSRLVRGKVGSLNFKLGAAILDEMRRRGFPMKVSDLITYYPSETLKSDSQA